MLRLVSFAFAGGMPGLDGGMSTVDASVDEDGGSTGPDGGAGESDGGATSPPASDGCACAAAERRPGPLFYINAVR